MGKKTITIGAKVTSNAHQKCMFSGGFRVDNFAPIMMVSLLGKQL
jgi:hypothetical protein